VVLSNITRSIGIIRFSFGHYVLHFGEYSVTGVCSVEGLLRIDDLLIVKIICGNNLVII
jgi:hypothetical protein